MKKVIYNVVCFFIFLISFNSNAQSIIKIEQNEPGQNKSVILTVNDLLNATDITFINSTGEINYGSLQSKILQLKILDINFANNVNSYFKNNIEFAIVRIPNDFNSTINLNNLNQFTALNFIFLIVEKIDLTDTALTNLISANNPNWTIVYQFSLPE